MAKVESKRLNVNIPVTLNNELDSISYELGITKSSLVILALRDIVNEYKEKLEKEGF